MMESTTSGSSETNNKSSNDGISKVSEGGKEVGISHHIDDLQTNKKRQQKCKRYKLVIVGDGACGKTSLLTVFKTGKFPRDYIPTIFDTDVAYISVDGKDIELTLWDTAGQEIYERLRRLSYPSADVILICFAIDRPETLDHVKSVWAPEVAHFCKDVPVVLVGNKTDLRNDPQVIHNLAKIGKIPVGLDLMRTMADSVRAMAYHECSAKYQDGVKALFMTAARAAMTRSRSRISPSSCCDLL